MIRRLILLVGITAALGLASNFGASAQPDQPAASSSPTRKGAIHSVTEITFHGKITEVDRANKLVTLEGVPGGKVVLRVQNPYNLKAAKVGEPVVIRFYEVVTMRRKKPGETVPTASL